MKNNERRWELYERLIRDDRIDLEHVNLFIGIYYWWVQNKYQNPIAITSKIVIQMSRIKNLSVYNKCMKDLHDFGYIKYIPSFHPELGSTIYIIDKNETPVISKE